MSFTKSQEKAIAAIQAIFHNVELHTKHEGMLFASFDNGETHLLLEVGYNVQIGKGGRIIFIGINSFDTARDKKHQRVLARLACYKLNDNNHRSSKVKLV